MLSISKEDLTNWYTLREQLVNAWHLSAGDKSELIRLNHLVMEASQEIHNKNMLDDIKIIPYCKDNGHKTAPDGVCVYCKRITL